MSEGVFENKLFSGQPVCFNEDERVSAAHPDAAKPPSIAIPEALPLPVTTVRVSRHIGWSAVISVTGSIVARSISIRSIRAGCDRAANDGAADQPAGDGRADTALGMGWRYCSRNGQRGDGSQCHQSLPHGITFLIE